MRIIGGNLRGRRLETPKDESIRPTSDMVKESVFNIIQFQVKNAKILDLFSGTGQMGLEALSRGAEHCVFVDSSREAAALIKRNLALCQMTEHSGVVVSTAENYVGTAGGFDIIFLDPPYNTGLHDIVLKKIIEFDILREDGIILCESSAAEPPAEVSPPYRKKRIYKYGRTLITVYDKQTHLDKD